MIALLLTLLTPRDEMTDLIATLRAAAPADQARIAPSIVPLAKPAHVPLLLKEADAGPANLRIYFIWALGRAGSDEAKQALRHLCERNELPSRAAAATQLAQLKDDSGLRAMVALLPNLGSEQDQIAVVAGLSGARGESPEAAKGLVEFLDRASGTRLRRLTLRALSTIKDPATAAALKKVAADPRDEVQVDALAYLAQAGDEAALATALKMLETRPLEVDAIYQVLAAVQVRNRRSELPRLRVLAEKSEDPNVRQYVVLFLGLMRDAEAEPVLLRLAKDSNPGVANAALQALAQIPKGAPGPESAKEAKEASPGINLAAAETMLRQDKAEAMETVKAALASEAANDRVRAVTLLGGVPRRQSVELLLPLLDDRDEQVRRQAKNGVLDVLRALYPYVRFDPQASPEKIRAWWARNRN